MNVYGHTALVNSLRSELPRVSLFVGPRSVGKWTTAEHLAHWHTFPTVHRARTLTTEQARAISRRSLVEPTDGNLLVIVRLGDYGEQRIPQNILLKSLEEPARHVSFVLISHDTVAETIASRTTQYEFGLLPDTVVAQVLRERGLPDYEVDSLVQQAGGRVGQALRMAELLERKALVISAVKAIQSHDSGALAKCADGWTDEHTTAAVALCYQVITERSTPGLYTTAELGDMGKRLATRILIALREDHRPRLVVRGALQQVLESTS